MRDPTPVDWVLSLIAVFLGAFESGFKIYTTEIIFISVL